MALGDRGLAELTELVDRIRRIRAEQPKRLPGCEAADSRELEPDRRAIARPRVVLERPWGAGASRVLDDVPNRVLEVRVHLEELAPVALAEEVVDATVLDVELAGICGVELAHPASEPALVDADDEVVVVPHQAVRQKRPAESDSGPIQRRHEQRAVSVVQEDVLLVVPTRADVVAADALVSRFAWHAPTVGTPLRARKCPLRSRRALVRVSRRCLAPDVAAADVARYAA